MLEMRYNVVKYSGKIVRKVLFFEFNATETKAH